MKKNINLAAIAVGGGVVLLAVLFFWSFGRPAKTVSLPRLPVSAITAEAQTIPAASLEITTAANAPNLVDPFSFRVSVRKKESELSPTSSASITQEAEPKLEGTWVDAGMRAAFISGQSLSVGDTIMGWTVDAIYKDRVVIHRGAESRTLKLEAR